MMAKNLLEEERYGLGDYSQLSYGVAHTAYKYILMIILWNYGRVFAILKTGRSIVLFCVGKRRHIRRTVFILYTGGNILCMQ